MYKIIKAVIESKRYELEDMLKKLDTFWAQTQLSESEYTELVSLARANALAENSYAGTQARIDNLYQKVAELEERVRTLEGTTKESPDVTEFPEYIQPTGAHDAYYTGDKVTYNSKQYVCVAPEGIGVVWSPDVMPAYWEAAETTE